MKKIVMIIMCLFIIVGCDNATKKENNNTTTTTTTRKVEALSFQDIGDLLFDEAIKLYNDKEYLKFDKENNKYYITLGNLVNKYNFDDSRLINPENNKKCDREKTTIYFDIDHVDNIEYERYPITIALFCK